MLSLVDNEHDGLAKLVGQLGERVAQGDVVTKPNLIERKAESLLFEAGEPDSLRQFERNVVKLRKR